tara:strand:- start:575 stop:850 length:276 start_codon:yes stop_codon:yes gene_type:complete
MGSYLSKEVSRQVWIDRLSDVVYFFRQGFHYWRDLIVMKAPYKWSAQILLSSNRLKKVEFFCESNLREDAEQRCKALFGVTDVRQMLREWN